MSRSSVPCGRSNLSGFFMPMASTYTPSPVEVQGVAKSGPFVISPLACEGGLLTAKSCSSIPERAYGTVTQQAVSPGREQTRIWAQLAIQANTLIEPNLCQ